MNHCVTTDAFFPPCFLICLPADLCRRKSVHFMAHSWLLVFGISLMYVSNGFTSVYSLGFYYLFTATLLG